MQANQCWKISTVSSRATEDKGLLGRLCALSLDLVLAFEHFVDLYEVICPFDKCLRVTFGRVALLEMSLFPQYAHLH